MKYNIVHLFPKLLNLYSDRGNILALKFMAESLGLTPIISEIDDVNLISWDEIDFLLIGGGSDREQAIVTNELKKIKDQLTNKINNGLPTLCVCGGYQFLGKKYIDQNGIEMDGIGILDFVTIGQSKKRMIGNIVLDSKEFGTIIGFENHAGETKHNYEPLADVVVGYGNDLVSKKEGIRYKNLIGTYLHGPILPKNTELTLFFIKLFAKKNNLKLDYSVLDHSYELQATNNLKQQYINK